MFGRKGNYWSTAMIFLYIHDKDYDKNRFSISYYMTTRNFIKDNLFIYPITKVVHVND